MNTIDSGAGNPILWIHGFPLSSAVHGPQLAIDGYRHIVPDLPGFGESEPVDAVRMDDYAEALLVLLDRLRIRSLAMAGLSMGGYVLFALARKSLARIAAMILIDTREVADTVQARQKRFELIQAVHTRGISAVVEDMLPKLLGPNARADQIAEIEAIIRTSSQKGVIAALEAMANRPDSSELLLKLNVPSLVVVGSKDGITPPGDAERMARALPDARLRVIEGAGHLSNFEKPDEFNRVVTEFLREIRY